MKNILKITTLSLLIGLSFSPFFSNASKNEKPSIDPAIQQEVLKKRNIIEKFEKDPEIVSLFNNLLDEAKNIDEVNELLFAFRNSEKYKNMTEEEKALWVSLTAEILTNLLLSNQS